MDHGLGVAFFTSEPPNDMPGVNALIHLDRQKKTHSQKQLFKHDVNFKVGTKDFKILLEVTKSLHDASHCKEVPKLINSHEVF